MGSASTNQNEPSTPYLKNKDQFVKLPKQDVIHLLAEFAI